MYAMLAVAGAVILSTLGGPVPSDPPETPPPYHVVVSLLSANGSGCRPGTTSVGIFTDNSAFQLAYGDYTARVGIGAKPTDSRKECQVAVQVHAPAGFTYAIRQVDYHGFGYLEAKASGSLDTSYYFQGQSPATYEAHSFVGPMEDDWQVTDAADLTAATWAPCDGSRYLNMSTRLRVRVGSSDPATTTSALSMSSTTFSTTYGLMWKRCPATAW